MIHTESTRSKRNAPRIHRKREQEVFVLREGDVSTITTGTTSFHKAYSNKVESRPWAGAGGIANPEQEESRKSIEDEKLKVENEKKVSEATLF